MTTTHATKPEEDSDATSLAAAASPKRGGDYYVQSPSAHEGGYKSAASMQATPAYTNTPSESPSSYGGRHSRSSSFASRFSVGKGWAGGRRALGGNGWAECNVIEEEGAYKDLAGDRALSRPCQIVMGFLTFVLLFATFCLVIWGAARQYEPEVVVKSLVIDNFYAGQGTDHSGVPTKLVTVNCSLHIAVYNPAPMFGIHVTSGPIHMIYSDVSIGSGQLRRHYQPRKSHRTATAIIRGKRVPLYGAGDELMPSSTGVPVPLKLDFDLTSRGYVVGKLVRVTHKLHVTCPVVLVDAEKTKPIRLSKKACAVYKV